MKITKQRSRTMRAKGFKHSAPKVRIMAMSENTQNKVQIEPSSSALILIKTFDADTSGFLHRFRAVISMISSLSSPQ